MGPNARKRVNVTVCRHVERTVNGHRIHRGARNRGRAMSDGAASDDCAGTAGRSGMLRAPLPGPGVVIVTELRPCNRTDDFVVLIAFHLMRRVGVGLDAARASKIRTS